MINAYEYGKALFALAEEEGIADQVFFELETVAEILVRETDYRTLLDTPAIPTGEKPQLIETAFASAHRYVRDFLKMLSERRSIGALGECVRVYGMCLDEARGILRAKAVTAVAMSEAQTQRLSEKLAALTGKTVVLTNVCDPSVIGGVSLHMDGTRLDGSVRAKLEAFRKQLSDLTI